MGAPDLEALETKLGHAERQAACRSYEYASGPSYYDGKAAAESAAARARQLRARIAERTEAGAKLRQKIGIARRELGVPEEAHRARVERLSAGRTGSTLDCTLEELRAVLAEYQAGGFKVRPPRAARRAPAPEQADARPMIAKIGALLADQRLPWTYAEAVLRRQRGILDKGIACPIERADGPELRAVIAALSARQARQRREEAPSG